MNIEIKEKGQENPIVIENPSQEAPLNLHSDISTDEKSEEYNDVLGQPPSWLIRSGITMVFVTFFTVVLLSSLIKYPDTVHVDLSIVTQDMPASVVAKNTGRITHLFITENEKVKKGQTLAVIENSANYEEVEYFYNWLKGYHNYFEQDSLLPIQSTGLKIGDLQAGYEQLQLAHNEYLYFLLTDLTKAKIANLNKEADIHKVRLQQLQEKETVFQKSFLITERHYQAEKILLENGAIPLIQFENTEKGYWNEKLNLQTLRSDRLDIEKQTQNLKKDIIDLQFQYNERKRSLKKGIEQALQQIKAEYKKWKETYVLTAPVEGQVSFYKYWTLHQLVNSGDEVMIILPPSDNLYAFGYLPAQNSGKVQQGQKVRIELTDYPAHEFGTVNGQVISKSKISRESKYLVRVALPNGLLTDLHYMPKLSQEMKAAGQIVTKDLRLIDRFVHNFRAAINRSSYSSNTDNSNEKK